MRIAYLDCFSGISGDMFLGALLDAGVPFELFEKAVAALNIGATLERSRVDRAGISATKLDVVVDGVKDMPREQFWEKHATGTRGEGFADRAEHSHVHKDRCDDGPQVHGRRLSDILKVIAASQIGDCAQQMANEIFLALAAAEAKVHNSTSEDIHFHEVGAADAIVDIVCAAVGAEALGVERFVCSPLNVGSGTLVCSHGVMPVPAPATLELLKGLPIYSGDIEKELVTPTGAAIVHVLTSSCGPRPLMTADAIGYGAGSRDFPSYPNVLRISIGESLATGVAAGAGAQEETIAILEANLDDLNPQLIGYIVDQAFAEGALDVFTTPVQMKKNRPGTVLTILALPSHEERLRALLFRESSTLGVRVRHETRYILPRQYETVVTPWGEVRMKVAGVNGVSQYAPEYEDCRRIAAQHHVPLKHVMQEAIRLYLDRQHG
ncbi:MAG TPA: nickel pincer cofactor biosynthesis protein LarC [Terriglobales bacterium]|nr:nickel pincer cofactor biosynthesis protein LarC [Terriglobales bacterium]